MEHYLPTTDVVAFGGFISSDDLSKFCKSCGIAKHQMGWPVLEIMKALNKARKGKLDENQLKDRLTSVKIEKEQIANAIKLKQYIPRDLAINRMRLTCLATAGKIRNAAKASAPAILGLVSPQDIENVLINHYNLAIEQLYSEAEQLVDWEQYGNILFQQGGEAMASSPQEDSGKGSSVEDSGLSADEYLGENRLGTDSVPGRSNLANWRL